MNAKEGEAMSMKRILGGLVLLTGVLVFSAWADQQTNYDIAKVGGSELKIGLGPRPVAMGETFVAKADDLNSTAWNPAGLSQMQGYQAGFMHNLYLQETSLEYLAYAQNLFEGAGLGAQVTYLNYGSIDKYKEDANHLPEAAGTFTPSVLMAAVGYGQWLMADLAVGGSIKMISQSIDTENYSAFAVDLGALYRTGVEGLQLGLAVQNLGTKLADANLPMNVKAGAAYAMPFKVAANDSWNVLCDANVPFGDTKYTSANLGTEYWYNQMLAARVGYKVKDTGELGGVTGLTAGVGVKVAMLSIDYALVSFGDLGLTHQFAIAASFQ
jgi:hypothetical protein